MRLRKIKQLLAITLTNFIPLLTFYSISNAHPIPNTHSKTPYQRVGISYKCYITNYTCRFRITNPRPRFPQEFIQIRSQAFHDKPHKSYHYIHKTKLRKLEKKRTIEELPNLIEFLLNKIESELSNKYGSKFTLIENHESILEVKIVNMYREITESNWENLKLTIIIPNYVQPNTINIVVVARLYTESGIRIDKFGSKTKSKKHNGLQEYIQILVTDLRKEISHLKLP